MAKGKVQSEERSSCLSLLQKVIVVFCSRCDDREAAVQVMEEATTTVELRPCNAVTAVVVDAASVPVTPVPAGSDMVVLVQLTTEDKNPVPLAEAMKGLTLQLMAPGTKSRAAQVCCHPVRLFCSIGA
jgi:hypothetical protein